MTGHRDDIALKVGGEIQRSRPLQVLLWVAGLSVIASVLMQVPLIAQRFIDPYEVTAATMVTQRIKPGDAIVVSYKAVRKRPCRVDYDRLIVRATDGVLLYRDRTPGGGHKIGNDTVLINSLLIPKDAEPGLYVLHTTVTNECKDGVHVTDAPPLQFEVYADGAR